MTFRHFQNSTHHTAAEKNRTQLLAALREHARDGVDALELRRHMGSKGYVPTGDRWEDDGDGSDVEGDDGETLLIGGTAPEDLVAEIFEAAAQDMADAGERRNYQVLALRHIEGSDGSEHEVVFKLSLPKATFASPEHSGGQGEDDANMAVFQLLLGHNTESHKVTMDMARQYPALLSRVTDLIPKLTEVLEQLAEQVTDSRRFDIDKVMALLDHEATREARWMEHDRARQRADHRAGLANQAFDLTGPAFKELLAKLMSQVFSKGSTASGEPTPNAEQDATVTQQPSSATASSTPTTATPPATESPLAQRLDALLRNVPDDKLDQAKALLTNDEWSLITAAREAEDDDSFRALFEKLTRSWREHGKEHTQQLMTDLAGTLGMRTVMGLAELLREVQGD
ncbi:MAG: hypothetical protein K0V04_02375 [Deltaproteobacteria bacterium]|nr:hypothetical protein [Deltaproteobacteria bacterium]